MCQHSNGKHHVYTGQERQSKLTPILSMKRNMIIVTFTLAWMFVTNGVELEAAEI